MSTRNIAIAKMNLAVDYLNSDCIELAIEALTESIELDSKYWGSHFNLGLAYKKCKQWESSLKSFLACRDLLPPKVSTETYASVYWNLGICSSVLKEWELARVAWYRLGFARSSTDEGPPSIPLGIAFVETDDGSLLRGIRLDPVRIMVQEVFGAAKSLVAAEVVHDAERIGTQRIEQATYPVYKRLA